MSQKVLNVILYNTNVDDLHFSACAMLEKKSTDEIITSVILIFVSINHNLVDTTLIFGKK